MGRGKKCVNLHMLILGNLNAKGNDPWNKMCNFTQGVITRLETVFFCFNSSVLIVFLDYGFVIATETI